MNVDAIEFSEAVCTVLDEIESGSVATYGDVARQLGISARQAGRDVSIVPDDVPWWRVVRADGTPAACRGGVPLRCSNRSLCRCEADAWISP